MDCSARARAGLHAAAVHARPRRLRHLSAFSTALALNLEPVYAIVLAILLLDEQRELAWPFYGASRSSWAW